MHIPPLKPEVLFNLGPLPITNSFLTSILAALLLCIFAIIVGTNFKRLPSGLQHLFEAVYEMFDNMATETLGKSGRKFTPFVATLFLFIIFNNWIGVLPGVGSLGFFKEVDHAAAVSTAETPAAGSTATSATSAAAPHAETTVGMKLSLPRCFAAAMPIST